MGIQRETGNGRDGDDCECGRVRGVGGSVCQPELCCIADLPGVGHPHDLRRGAGVHLAEAADMDPLPICLHSVCLK